MLTDALEWPGVAPEDGVPSCAPSSGRSAAGCRGNVPLAQSFLRQTDSAVAIWRASSAVQVGTAASIPNAWGDFLAVVQLCFPERKNALS